VQPRPAAATSTKSKIKQGSDSQGVDPAMYAIVKTGGKQYKVAEGDVIEVEKLDLKPGAEVALPAILLVDGEAVTHEAAKLAKVAVTAEVVAQTKGPKIRIHKYKNKTGYHKRMGHRQKLTQVKVTGITSGK
jgi:large subunit ribosomal protein L21